jgi:tetratricopeptide (TPR) repeat protein
MLIIFLNNRLISQEIINQPISQQLKNLELGKRYLKLGNSWRESRDFELSKKYLNMGYNTIIKYSDSYQLGVYYEYLGYLNRDEGEIETAIDNLRKAKAIFDKYGKTSDGTGSNIAIEKQIQNLENGNFTTNTSSSNENNVLKEQNRKLLNDNNELVNTIYELKNEIAALKKKIDEMISINTTTPVTGGKVTKKDSAENLNDVSENDVSENHDDVITGGGGTYFPIGVGNVSTNNGSNQTGSFVFMSGGGTLYSTEARLRLDKWELGVFFGYQELFESMYGITISNRNPVGVSWDVCTDLSLGKSKYGMVIDANVNFRYFITKNIGLYARGGYNLAYVLDLVKDSYMNLSAGFCIKI